MKCAICQTRRATRYCPGIAKNICAVCCGTEREVTVVCPLDCEFLIQAHKTERKPEVDPKELPNHGIEFPRNFLSKRMYPFAITGRALVGAARSQTAAYDSDMRVLIDSLVRTYKTAESGLVFEHIPDNQVAARMFRTFRELVPQLKEMEWAQIPDLTLRDREVLECLAYLQQVEYMENNGRPKGRAFLHMLHNQFGGFPGPETEDSPPSGLIIPG